MRDLIDSFIVFFFLLNHCFSSVSRFPRISCVVTVERSLNITGCHALLQNALCVLGVLIDLSSLNTFHRLNTCSLNDQLFILQLMVLMVCIAKKMLWVGGSRMMHNKGRHHLNLSKLRQGHDVFVFFDACALIWWFFSWLDLKRASFLTYSLFSALKSFDSTSSLQRKNSGYLPAFQEDCLSGQHPKEFLPHSMSFFWLRFWLLMIDINWKIQEFVYLHARFFRRLCIPDQTPRYFSELLCDNQSLRSQPRPPPFLFDSHFQDFLTRNNFLSWIPSYFQMKNLFAPWDCSHVSLLLSRCRWGAHLALPFLLHFRTAKSVYLLASGSGSSQNSVLY